MTHYAQARGPRVGWSVLCLVVHLQVVLDEVGLVLAPHPPYMVTSMGYMEYMEVYDGQ